MHKFSLCIGDAVGGTVGLSLLSCEAVGPLAAALATTAVEAEVVDHVVEAVEEPRGEPESVEHRVEEAGVAEVAE